MSMDTSNEVKISAKRLNDRLFLIITVLLLQVFLFAPATVWTYSFVSNLIDSPDRSGIFPWIVTIACFYLVVIFVQCRFFVYLYKTFSSDIHQRMFLISTLCAVATMATVAIADFAYPFLFFVWAGMAPWFVRVIAYAGFWIFAIAHCILLVKSMSKVFTSSVVKWAALSVVVKIAGLLVATVYLVLVFMSLSEDGITANIFAAISGSWWFFQSIDTLQTSLAYLDRFVYCAVLVYAFWNLPIRLEAQAKQPNFTAISTYSVPPIDSEGMPGSTMAGRGEYDETRTAKGRPKKVAIIAAIIIILGFVGIGVWGIDFRGARASGAIEATVIGAVGDNIIDVEVSGEVVQVQLMGVDIPEIDEQGGVEATAVIEMYLYADRVVYLEVADPPLDHLGRTKAFVWIKPPRDSDLSPMVNWQLLFRGWATASTSESHPYEDVFHRLEAGAKERRVGIWGL